MRYDYPGTERAHQKSSAEEKSDIELTRINVGDDSWRGEADVLFGASGRLKMRES